MAESPDWKFPSTERGRLSLVSTSGSPTDGTAAESPVSPKRAQDAPLQGREGCPAERPDVSPCPPALVEAGTFADLQSASKSPPPSLPNHAAVPTRRRPRKVDRAEFLELCEDAGLSRRAAAKFFGRSDRQFKRWLQFGAPPWVVTMLRMRAGWLDEYGWAGWRMQNGWLVSVHAKERFQPGDLFAWHYLRQWRTSYDREVAKCPRCNEELPQ